jgi:hypothetical protein
MCKYFFVVWVSIVNLSACEFMSGVTIQDPKVSELFATVSSLYNDDKVTSSTIEGYYEQYLCLLASQDRKDTAPLNDVSIIDNLKFLIAIKKSTTSK